MKNKLSILFFVISLLSITSLKAEYGFLNNNSTFQLKGVGACAGGGDPEPEVCDGIDNDCNGEIDDNPIDEFLWCKDLDSDEYGDANYQLFSCEKPNLYVSNCGDCDDTDDSIGGGCEIIIFINGFET